MCIALIGGMDRLERVYEQEAQRFGVKLKVFTRTTKNLGEKIGTADAIIVFTNKVSHTSRREVVSEAKNRVFRFCSAMHAASVRYVSVLIVSVRDLFQEVSYEKKFAGRKCIQYALAECSRC